MKKSDVKRVESLAQLLLEKGMTVDEVKKVLLDSFPTKHKFVKKLMKDEEFLNKMVIDAKASEEPVTMEELVAGLDAAIQEVVADYSEEILAAKDELANVFNKQNMKAPNMTFGEIEKVSSRLQDQNSDKIHIIEDLETLKAATEPEYWKQFEPFNEIVVQNDLVFEGYTIFGSESEINGPRFLEPSAFKEGKYELVRGFIPTIVVKDNQGNEIELDRVPDTVESSKELLKSISSSLEEIMSNVGVV